MKELYNLFSKYGLKIIEYKNSKEIYCEDQYGYKYKLNKYNFINKQKLPHLFRGNPYAIHNIHNYLLLEGSTLRLLSKEYHNCKEKLEFICVNHQDKGVQLKTLDDLINGKSRCFYCYHDRVGERCAIDVEQIISRCNDLNLEYIDKFIKNQETWVKYICKKHKTKGIQTISWYHLKTCAVGCPYCTGRYKTTEDFIADMNVINRDIEILGSYSGSEGKILCRCKKCGCEWKPVARSLISGQGCPRCCASKGEKRISEYLDSLNITYIPQKSFDGCIYKSKLKYDFYLPDYNMCIEYDGEQHFSPVDFAGKGIEWANNNFKLTQIKDEIKNKYCKDNGINIIRIPFWKYDSINPILDSVVKI